MCSGSYNVYNPTLLSSIEPLSYAADESFVPTELPTFSPTIAITTITQYFFGVSFVVGCLVCFIFWCCIKRLCPEIIFANLKDNSDDSRNHDHNNEIISPLPTLKKNNHVKTIDACDLETNITTNIPNTPSTTSTKEMKNYSTEEGVKSLNEIVLDDQSMMTSNNNPESKAIITIQPLSAFDMITTIPSNDEPYSIIIDSKKMNLFSIPILKVESQWYGIIKTLQQIGMIISFVLSFVTDPQNTISGDVLVFLIYFIIISWIIVPIWQNYSIVIIIDKDGNRKHANCSKGGCICCNCCCICCSLCFGRMICIPRVDTSRPRYIPNSIYNFIFMALNPHKRLNPKPPSTMQRWEFSTVYLLILTENSKGILNFYIFLNAILKLMIVQRKEGLFSISTGFALYSLFCGLLDLRVYVLSVLFGMLLLPYTVLFVPLCCFCDCSGYLEESVCPKRDTVTFILLEKYWNFACKYG
eukprot:gene4165-5929_t